MALREGVHGGIDLLDSHDRKKTDPEVAEHGEPLNERLTDSLSIALQQVMRKDPGGYISNKQYVVTHNGSRDTEIVFDRFYWSIGLLVDMLGAPLNDADREAVAKLQAEHNAYALSINLRYLAVVGGATLGDIEAAVG